jgi:LysM repeat protein
MPALRRQPASHGGPPTAGAEAQTTPQRSENSRRRTLAPGESAETAQLTLDDLFAEVDAAQAPADGMGKGSSAAAGWGTELASFNGVSAYSNGGDSRYFKRGEYGHMYQCVEFVNRYSAQANGTGNMIGTGNAIDYAGDSRAKFGYRWTPNNGQDELPQAGDILVFEGGTYGHVAIATGGDETGVGMIQQNTRSANATLSVSGEAGDWSVRNWGSMRLLGWQTLGAKSAKAPKEAGPGKTAGGTSYTVRPGDTLWAIAQRLLGDGSRYPELAKLNNLKDASSLVPGQVLRVVGATKQQEPRVTTPKKDEPEDAVAVTPKAPKPRTHTVRRGESLWAIAAATLGDGSRYRELATLNHIANPSHIVAGQVIKLPA